MTEALFWISITAIGYTYLGYPAAIWVLARLRNHSVKKAYITPTVSVVVACHNEEGAIGERIRNLLQSAYPPDCLEIIIVSDGSSDLTAQIARSYCSNRVQVAAYAEHKGKAAAVNAGMALTTGEIVVFADARQRFEPDAIKELVANFADDDVGAVSGELFLDGPAESTGGESVGLYWRYEKWIRKNESRRDSVIGATGAIYAIRRRLFRPLPARTILDDVYIPMQIALRGWRVVFEHQARAHDSAANSTRREFARKTRTLAGNYQLCQLMPRLLDPRSRLWGQFFSHKVMRLGAPVFMLLLLASNLIIAMQGAPPAWRMFYLASLASQAAFYFIVALGYLSGAKLRIPLMGVIYGFSVMNAAALVGLIHFIRGKHDIWSKNTF